ncbi:uncharacterized protein J3D65DRAFT_105697 [Phyllosticta citribraziliensis]|uniref:Histone lysine methyltransferase SET associated domain-containing protein n=1 Tax=Phyllosticta citribraziliensis TaxID=989973 RepID=A0ABR1LD92_9PEZI
MGNPNMDWSPVRKTGSARPRESPSYSPYRTDDQGAYDSDGYRPGRPGPYPIPNKPPFAKFPPRRPFEPTPTDRYRHDDFHQPRSPPQRMEDGHQKGSPRPSGRFEDLNRPCNNRPRPFQDSPPSSPRPPRPSGRSDPFDNGYFDSRPQPSGSADRKRFMEAPNFVSNSSLTWKKPTSRDSSRSESSRQPFNGSGSEDPPRSIGPGSNLVSGSAGMTFAEQDFQRQLVEGRSWVVTREELPALLRLPHIFISARHVPYRSTNPPHIARLLRSAYKQVRVQGCVDGYYVSFRNNSDGRAGLRRCVERHDGTLLFNKFEMVMEPHLPGLDSSSSQDLTPVTHAPHQQSAEMLERNLPPAPTASPAQTTTLGRHSLRPDALQKPSDNISSERNLPLNNPHLQSAEMSSQHNLSPNVPPTRTMKPPDRNPNTLRQQIVKTSNQLILETSPLHQQSSRTPRQQLDEAEEIAIQGAASRATPTEKVSNFLQQCKNSGVVAIFDHAEAWGLPKGRPGWSVKLKVDDLEIGDPGPHPSKMDASAAIVGRGFRLLEQALQAQDCKSPVKLESLETAEASTDATVGSAATNANIRRLQEDINSRLSRAKELQDWLVANPTAEEATIERSRGYHNDIMDRVEGIRQEIIKLGGVPASAEGHGADESSPPVVREPTPLASADKGPGVVPASAEEDHGTDGLPTPLAKEPPPLASADNESGAFSASAEESHGADESSPPLVKQPPPLASADIEPGVDHQLLTSRDSISAPDHGQARPINEPTRRKSTATLSDASETSSKTKVTRCAYCKTKHFPSYNPRKTCSGCRRAYCSSCWKTESARALDSNAEPEGCRHCVKTNTRMLPMNHESHPATEQLIAPKTSEPKVTTPPVDIPQPAHSAEVVTREAPSPIRHDERLESEHREGPAEALSQVEKRLLERRGSNRDEAPAASPSHAETRMLPDPEQAERSDAPAASPSHTGTGTIPGRVQTDRTEASELYLKKLSGINELSWSDLLGFALADNGNRGMTWNEISAWMYDNFRDNRRNIQSSSIQATLSGQKTRFSHVVNSKPARYYATDAFAQNCTKRLLQLRAQARYIVKLPLTQSHKLGVEKSAIQSNEATGPQATRNMDGAQETNEKNLKRPREESHEEMPSPKAPRKFAYRARKSASNGKRLQPPVKQESVRISAPASGPDGISSAGSQSEATPGAVENQGFGSAPKSVEVISLSSDSSSDESRPVSPAPLYAPRVSLRSVSPEPVSAPPDLSRPVSPASDSDPPDSPQDPRMAFALATLEKAKSLPGSRPVTMPEDLVVNGFSEEFQDRLTARYKAEFCSAPTIVKDLAKEAPAFCPPPFDREAKIAEIKARPKRKARLEALNAKVDAPRLLHARQERSRDAIHKEEHHPLPPAYKAPPPGAWSFGFGTTHDLTVSQETDDVDMDADNKAPRRKERRHFEVDDTDVDMDADNEAPQPKEKDYVETVEEWLGGPPADSVTYMITDRGKLAFREKAAPNRDGRMPRPRKVWVVPD